MIEYDMIHKSYFTPSGHLPRLNHSITTIESHFLKKEISLFNSTLTISELRLSDSDVYTCIGAVLPVDGQSSSILMESISSAQYTLTVCESVNTMPSV